MNAQHGLPDTLVSKMDYYFSHADTVIGISQEYEIHTVLRILPPNLKTKLSLFLYQEAIRNITFLQQRDQMFYLNYLDKLIPLRFKADMVMIKEKNQP